MRHRTRLLAVCIAAGAVASCGAAPGKAAQLLVDAKGSVDTTAGLHFTLTSRDVTGTGPLITGGEGDAHRPDGFRGSLSVVDSGFTITVDIISVGGAFYARTPLTGAGYIRTDPATYGFGDPGRLLDPANGLSSLLADCTGATDAAGDRLNGEQLDEVACAIPGARVAALLTSADPSKPVMATVGVDAATHQLRRVVLVGPFFSTTQSSTFTVVLTNYGENVSVTPPPT